MNQTPPQTPPQGNTSGGSSAFQFGSFNISSDQSGRVEIQFGNPYYLNPNENLSQSIVSEVFDGTNYSMWSRSMRLALKTKHKLGFVDGSILAPPTTDERYYLWDGCNTLVLCWIMNSLQKDIARSMMSHENARVLGEELCRRFAQPNAQRIINMEDEIQACKQGDMTVLQYYTKIQGLWEDYQ
ncbi:unnamed protein product [Linum trigynum]|uniref:Retrotransposon Copia-like N-terminal domain-containing protein n=1 Tax=Linum trigynum TaxID=586398 RepID=A0AAV2G787_9ROSI